MEGIKMEDEVGKTEVGAIMFSRFYHLAICFYSLVSPHLSMGLVGPFWHEQAWAHFKLNLKINHNIFLEENTTYHKLYSIIVLKLCGHPVDH